MFRAALAFNTAASFTTNTNWQNYGGESTMSYFTQMAGLAYHNFASAAVGIVLAIVVIRGIARKETDKLGNFWVDMTRCLLWVLLPLCLVGSLVLVSQGVIQNLKPYTTAELTEPQTVQVTGTDGKTTTQKVTEQVIAQGPVASQEIIKQLGTNGGGFFNANSAHPFENPTPLSNFLEMICIFAHLLGAHLHARTHDRFAASRLGSMGGDGIPVSWLGVTRHLLGRGQAAIRCWRAPTSTSPHCKPAATWKAKKCGSESRIPHSLRLRPPTPVAAR